MRTLKVCAVLLVILTLLHTIEYYTYSSKSAPSEQRVDSIKMLSDQTRQYKTINHDFTSYHYYHKRGKMYKSTKNINKGWTSGIKYKSFKL